MSLLTTVIGRGLLSARPAAAAANEGYVYSASDASLYRSNGSSWDTIGGAGLTDPMTTRGDMIIRDASNVTARVGIGSAGKVWTSDGTDPSWQTPAAAAFTTVSAQQGADIAVSAATYTDIVSVSLVAGTWDIWAVLSSRGPTTTNAQYVTYAQLYNATDAAQVAQEAYGQSNPTSVTADRMAAIPVLVGGLVLAGTKTIKLRMYCDLAATAWGSTSLGTGGGSKIHAMKIA